MAEKRIAMTQKAVDRLAVVQRVVGKQIRQQDAARQLGLSVRQVRRLVAGSGRRGLRGWYPAA